MRSVGSIAKITKAMKMVATAKMKIEVINDLWLKDEKTRRWKGFRSRIGPKNARQWKLSLKEKIIRKCRQKNTISTYDLRQRIMRIQ